MSINNLPLPLSRDLGGRVLSHLGDLAELPKSGYLAGQSVSSAVFDLFSNEGNELAVYNDLDIFRPATKEDRDIVLEQQREIDTVKFQRFEIDRQSGHLLMSVSRSYDVVRSYREGLVNQVAFENLTGCYYSPYSPLQTLLSGFDLNCTQVGIDLETGALEWTQAFQRFYLTRQLEICNVQTPYHTAMRWFKKKSDLPGCFGDNQIAMELIALLSYVKGPKAGVRHHEREYLRWRFGAKSASLFPQHELQLRAYFDLVQQSDSIFLLDPRGEPDCELIELGKKYPLRALAHVYNEYRRPRKKAKKKRVQFLLTLGCNMEMSSVPLTLGSYLKQGDEYLSGNIDTKQLAAVNSFSKHHPELMLPLLDEPAFSQLQHQKGWEQLERRFGHWIYGYMEVLTTRYGRLYRENPYLLEELFESELTHLFDEDAKLVKHKPIIRGIGDFTIKELITRAELMREGDQLHHCVGGYASEIYLGKSRIFSISNSDNSLRSTLELRVVDEEAQIWELAQHRSYCNIRPPEKLEAIAESFLGYFLADIKRQARIGRIYRRLNRLARSLLQYSLPSLFAATKVPSQDFR